MFVLYVLLIYQLPGLHGEYTCALYDPCAKVFMRWITQQETLLINHWLHLFYFWKAFHCANQHRWIISNPRDFSSFNIFGQEDHDECCVYFIRLVVCFFTTFHAGGQDKFCQIMCWKINVMMEDDLKCSSVNKYLICTS